MGQSFSRRFCMQIPVAKPVLEEAIEVEEEVGIKEQMKTKKSLRDALKETELKAEEKANEWVHQCLEEKIEEIEQDLYREASCGNTSVVEWMDFASDIECKDSKISSCILLQQFEKVGIPLIIEHFERNEVSCVVLERMASTKNSKGKRVHRLKLKFDWK